MENKLKCEVVILPNTGAPYPLFISNKTGEIAFSERQYPDKETSQHLYLVSDREIKEGDWFHDFYSGTIIQFRGEAVFSLSIQKGLAEKCEATTDPSLGLPIIPKSFIEYYVQKQGKVNEVFVKITRVRRYGCVDCGDPELYDGDRYEDIIEILPTKDSWNREEVRQIVRDATFFVSSIPGCSFNPDEWFDKNY